MIIDVERQSISDEIWYQNYQGPEDQTITDTVERQARTCSGIEKPEIREQVYQDFKWLLSDFRGIAGGRVTANLGITGRESVTLFNCFVHNPGDIGFNDPDSIEGIYEMLKAQAHTLKSEGGYGMNFSWIRPNGSYVDGIDSRTPGVLSFMELWDTSSKIVTQGSEKVIGKRKKGEKKKIRKGAQMGILECVSGDTLVSTINGKFPIKDLVGKNPYVYCTDGNGNVLVRQSNKVWKKGTKKTVKILIDNDDCIICTPEHEVMLSNGKYKKAKDLKFGDSLAAFHKRLYHNYLHLSVAGSRKTIAEHIAVAECKFGKYPITKFLDDGRTFDDSSEIIHHIDNNHVNNDPDNLQIITRKEHSEIHYNDSYKVLKINREKIANDRRGKTYKEYYGEDKGIEISKKRVQTSKKNNIKPWNFGLSGQLYKDHYQVGFSNQFKKASNHKVVSVIDNGVQDVYDMSVPDYHNFVANGIFVHNCWHPDIEDFIDAKLAEGRLSKFNLSIGITEGFMDAVVNDKDWALRFPNTSCLEFKTQWFGNLYDWESKNLPTITYKTVKAKGLWNKLIKSTYTRNDPGVIFLDIANKRNPLYYAERIATTNPCFAGSERFLTTYGYMSFEKSAKNDLSFNILVDGRISYEDNGPEKPENWKISTDHVRTVERKASSAFVTKEYSDLLLLEFANGQTLKCTPDHHIATSEGMIEAQYLTPEHEILVPKVEVPESSIFGKIPETQDCKAAFLMGLISGDGCCNNNIVHIDLWEDDRFRMKEICCNIIDSLFNIPVNKPDNWRNRQLSNYYISETEGKIRISSTWLKYFLEQYYGFDKKKVPAFVMENARTDVGRFYLSGLYYADGTISKDKQKGISVRLAQSNKDFLKDIQLICHANGLITSIYKRRDVGISTFKTGSYEHKAQYELITTHGSWKDFDHIGFAGHPNKDPFLKNSKLDIVKNYTKHSYTSIISIMEIEGDTVYCLKEDISRSVTVNSIAARRCGEILMPTGVCLLFSLNLVKYIKKVDDHFEFDFQTFRKAVGIATRFADNINDISNVPLPEYKKAMIAKRRLGIGVLALGSLHYILGIRFGSEKSQQLIHDIFKAKAEEEIMTSCLLGQEKGSFPLFDKEKYFSSYWWKTLPISEDVKRTVEEIGTMRNSHRSANAPTGNMSLYAGVVSGGIEPVFMKEYSRWSVVPENQRIALKEQGFSFPDVFNGQWFETEHLKASKAGTDDVLLGKFNGKTYQIDRNRGLTVKTDVVDWGWQFVKNNFTQEQIDKMEADGVFCTTEKLSVTDHINSLKVISPFIDQNSSKTINVPGDYPFDDFEDVYLKAWEAGIKGITTYRAGTMTAVLEERKDIFTVDAMTSVKRPKELLCEIHRPKINGQEWGVIVGLLDDEPFEIFAGPLKLTDFPGKGFGVLIKKKRGVYSLRVGNVEIENVIDYFADGESAWATRMISMCLRHRIPLKFISEQLSKDGYITDVNNVLARILRKYTKVDGKMKCPSCGSEKVVLAEGCMLCLDCNGSKCG